MTPAQRALLETIRRGLRLILAGIDKYIEEVGKS